MSDEDEDEDDADDGGGGDNGVFGSTPASLLSPPGADSNDDDDYSGFVTAAAPFVSFSREAEDGVSMRYFLAGVEGWYLHVPSFRA